MGVGGQCLLLLMEALGWNEWMNEWKQRSWFSRISSSIRIIFQNVSVSLTTTTTSTSTSTTTTTSTSSIILLTFLPPSLSPCRPVQTFWSTPVPHWQNPCGLLAPCIFSWRLGGFWRPHWGSWMLTRIFQTTSASNHPPLVFIEMSLSKTDASWCFWMILNF